MRKARIILTAILFFACYSSNYGQVKSGSGNAIKKEGRFISDLSSEYIATPYEVDKTGLMKGFDLHLEWWMLLGEPIEHYDFRWHAADKYNIDGKWVYRSSLEKYPDLLKRYDNIRPIEVNLLLTGSFSGLPGSFEIVPELLKPFYNSNTSFKTPEQTDFKYLINDIRLMRSKSGLWGKGITPTSPLYWEHFLQYRTFINPNSPTLWALVKDNNRLNNTADLSKEEVLIRRGQLKELFIKANKIDLHVKPALVKWPLSELRAIAEKYEKYESGEDEPSPKELVSERIEEENKNLQEYDKDDFWSEPENFETEIELYTRPNGKRALRFVGSGKPVEIPGNHQEIKSLIAGKYILVYNGNKKKLQGCKSNIKATSAVREYDLIDLSGQIRLRNITYAIYYNDKIRVGIAKCLGSGSITFQNVGEIKFFDEDLNLISSSSNKNFGNF